MPLGSAQRRALLLGGDVLVLVAVCTLALRLGAARSDWEWDAEFVLEHAAWYGVLGGLWVALAWINGLYDPRRAPDRWASAVLSVKVSAQVLLAWAVAYFVPPPWTIVRHVVVFFTLGAALVMPLWRLTYAVLFSQPAFRRRLLIVGAGAAGREAVDVVRAEAAHGFDVLGFVDDAPHLCGAEVAGVSVVADRSGLARAARELGATELVLAITRGMHGDLLAAVLELRERGLAVTPMPVLFEEVTGRVPVEHVGDHWAVALPLDGPEARGFYRPAKRALDVALGAAGLALLALAFPPAALLIRRSSPGPVLFRQRRVGRGGREFVLLKLRTMVTDAEPAGPVWAARDDPRVTPVGRWLRRARLDELPQAFNVLRGDMSVVGPRPERPEFVERLAAQIPFYRARHAVRPGLTGWATIHEGYAGSSRDALRKLQRDLYYIKHQSLFLDAYILVRTAGIVLRLQGR